MPYISCREEIDETLVQLLKLMPQLSAGDVNYVLTRVVDAWANVEEPSYYIFSQCIAAFECAKLEYYRRQLVPLENAKCAANGDVYQQRDFKPLPAIELPGKDESNGQS